MSNLANRTAGHLVAPDGSLLQRPTTLIGADTAAIIRAYFAWAMQNQLEPELVCGACFDHSRESKAIFTITDQQVVIVCECSIRYFEGATLPPAKLAPSMSVPEDAQGAILVQLSPDQALLLRTYKKVLTELNLKEMLRCNACYTLHGPSYDGCAARVTASLIEIRCRCSHRIFRGMSV